MDDRSRDSARNLLHFNALQSHHHPKLEVALRQQGLNSLTGCDSQLPQFLAAELHWLSPLQANPAEATGPSQQEGSNRCGSSALCSSLRAVALRGSRDGTAIMVTLSSGAIRQPELIQELVQAGMGLARINSAHVGPETWRELVHQVHAVRASSGKT